MHNVERAQLKRFSVEDFKRFLTVKKPVSANSFRLIIGRIDTFHNFLQRRNLSYNSQSTEDFIYYLRKEAVRRDGTKGLRNNSVNTYVFALSYLRDYYLDRKIVSGDFMDGIVKMEKQKPIIVPLEPSELERLLSVNIEYPGLFRGMDCSKMNQVYKTLIRFIAMTGCRFEEAQNLKVKNVFLDAEKVLFERTKGKEHRFVFLREPLLQELKEQVSGADQESYVFRNMLAGRIIPQGFGQELKKRGIKAGITRRVHPHLLRHTYATDLLQNGVGIESVATLLGHKNIQTTFESYAHLADHHLRSMNDHHTLNRQGAPPIELMAQINQAIESFNLEKDSRFRYELKRTGSSLHFNLEINE